MSKIRAFSISIVIPFQHIHLLNEVILCIYFLIQATLSFHAALAPNQLRQIYDALSWLHSVMPMTLSSLGLTGNTLSLWRKLGGKVCVTENAVNSLCRSCFVVQPSADEEEKSTCVWTHSLPLSFSLFFHCVRLLFLLLILYIHFLFFLFYFCHCENEERRT